MTKKLNRICFTAILLGLPLVVGCGRSDEPQVVSGVTPDFLAEIEAGQAEYAQQMQSGGKK